MTARFSRKHSASRDVPAAFHAAFAGDPPPQPIGVSLDAGRFGRAIASAYVEAVRTGELVARAIAASRRT